MGKGYIFLPAAAVRLFDIDSCLSPGDEIDFRAEQRRQRGESFQVSNNILVITGNFYLPLYFLHKYERNFILLEREEVERKLLFHFFEKSRSTC